MKLSPLMYERVFFCPWLVDKERDGRKTGTLLAQQQHRVLRDKRRQISTAYSISFLHLAQCSLFLVYESYHMAFYLYNLNSFWKRKRKYK